MRKNFCSAYLCMREFPGITGKQYFLLDNFSKVTKLYAGDITISGSPAYDICISKKHNPLIAADFFKLISQFKSQERLFDVVILDPPFFSTTRAGRVDMVDETKRLINKVRPLVAHNGKLIVINNALYVSGSDFMQTLQQICRSGYAQIEDHIPVPEDVLGNPLPESTLPADPAPFPW